MHPCAPTFLSALGIYIVVVVLTRLRGLRTYSKITSYDFAITIAIGSVIASTLMGAGTPLLQGAVALASLILLQLIVAALRRRHGAFRRLVDNTPVLLMVGEDVLEENMRKVQFTRAELRAKLRAANVFDLRQVRAVVMETTGDISVLHGPPDDPPLDPDLFDGIIGQERIKKAVPVRSKGEA